jgi:uncharacterized protein YdhG (YjbR/CyaY superfamily)
MSEKDIKSYLKKIPEERKAYFAELRKTIAQHIPKGFEESYQYGMIAYVVPHNKYPAGYHVSPEIPLPFISIANQKNYIALYHMGIYADPKLLDWFVKEYPTYCKKKLDMGKSCIRFKNPEEIPFQLIQQLLSKMTCEEWIQVYESRIK